jgi:tetratricopeptide (TPR) repeat protein
MSVDLRPVFPVSILAFPQVLGVFGYVGVLLGGAFLALRFADWRRLIGLGLLTAGILYVSEFPILWVQDPFVLYRSYLWSAGAALIVSALAFRFQWKYLQAAVVVIAVLWTIAAMNRVGSFASEESVWADAAAKVDLEAPANAVGRWRPLVNYGNQLLIKGDADGALAQYRKAQPLVQEKWLVYYQSALAFQLKGDNERAMAAFKLARSYQGPADKLALVRFHEGMLLVKLGRCAEAIEALDRAVMALADLEDKLGAFSAMAQCRIRLADAAGAVEAYRRALQIDPARRPAKLGLAMALSRNAQGGEALKLLDGLLAERDAAEVRLARALVHRSMKQLDAESVEIQAGLKLDPNNPLLLGLQREQQSAAK